MSFNSHKDFQQFTLSMLRARWCSASMRIPSRDVKVRLRNASIISYCEHKNTHSSNSHLHDYMSISMALPGGDPNWLPLFYRNWSDSLEWLGNPGKGIAPGIPSRKRGDWDENYDSLLILCMFFTNNSYCLESFVNANPTYKDFECFQNGLVHKFDGLKSYM